VQSGCTASAGVVACDANTVDLVTIRHVLDLDHIVQTRTTDATITQYDMTVTFENGKVRAVKSVGFRPADKLDLVLLQVERGDLRPDVDFVVLPLMEGGTYQVGDEVAAVGDPAADGMVLNGTQTFGHISAFRDGTLDGEFPGLWIQTDAAINHGNSGGPLLAKRGDLYFWVGINSDILGRDTGREGLNLSLDAHQVFSSKYDWRDATTVGMSQAIRDYLGIQW
jgi:S1-C subfamily serine protease